MQVCASFRTKPLPANRIVPGITVVAPLELVGRRERALMAAGRAERAGHPPVFLRMRARAQGRRLPDAAANSAYVVAGAGSRQTTPLFLLA